MEDVRQEPSRSGELGWYDSSWLAKYIEAKAIVARVAPDRLAEFTGTFEVLRVPGDFSQRFVAGFLSVEQLERIRERVRALAMDQLLMNEIASFGRFIVRNLPEFNALQADLVETVSALAGEPVEPSYNFLSLYTKAGVCQPHLDAPSAKWTLDICLDQSDPWPINFSRVRPWPETPEQLAAIVPGRLAQDPSLGFEQEVLMPGDAVLFSGTNQWHYRDALPRGPGKKFCDLLFLHYVPRGAAVLTQPKTWAGLFGIPELADMADIDQVD